MCFAGLFSHATPTRNSASHGSGSSRSLRKCLDLESSDHETRTCRWEASFDFRSVPPGDHVDLIAEYQTVGRFLQFGENSITVPLNVRADTAELTVWILMPEGKEYSDFRIIRYVKDKPLKAEAVKPVTEYLATDFRIIAFKILSLDASYHYEVSWTYR